MISPLRSANFSLRGRVAGPRCGPARGTGDARFFEAALFQGFKEIGGWREMPGMRRKGSWGSAYRLISRVWLPACSPERRGEGFVGPAPVVTRYDCDVRHGYGCRPAPLARTGQKDRDKAFLTTEARWTQRGGNPSTASALVSATGRYREGPAGIRQPGPGSVWATRSPGVSYPTAFLCEGPCGLGDSAVLKGVFSPVSGSEFHVAPGIYPRAKVV